MYYRKYRPQLFSEISKPNDVAVALSNQIKNNKSVHAYLFVGPRGTGKTTTARILAKALNCTDLKDNGDPCDKCDNCIAIKNGSFYDLIEIDAASNRGIDDIRELKEKIKLAPSAGKNKVYIIDEVHMLTPEAFNALLKTLEEPPANVTFILCTTEAHKVPATIKSRCQIFKFKRATIDQLTIKLESIVKNEDINIDKQDIVQIAKAAHGGFRDAETILQQVAEGEVEVGALVSVIDKEIFVELFDHIIKKDAKKSLHIVKKLYEDGVDLYLWTGELLKYLRDLLFIQVGANEEVQDVTKDLLEIMKSQAKRVDSTRLTEIIDTVIAAQNSIKDTFITQLPLEIAVVRLCTESEQPHDVQKESEKNPSEPQVSGDKGVGKIGVDKNEDKKTEKDEESTKQTREESRLVSMTVEETSAIEDGDAVIDIEIVKSEWSKVITEVKSINNSVSALLKTARPAGVRGNSIILDVPFDFHKERLENSKNRVIIEQTINKTLHEKLRIKCDVKKQNRPLKNKETGTLTDFNVRVPSKAQAPEMDESILDVFDGGLPLS